MTDIKLLLSLSALWIVSALLIYCFLIIISNLFNYRTGILFRLASFWIGIHYSKSCKRWCLNLIPCVTLYINKPNGVLPSLKLL